METTALGDEWLAECVMDLYGEDKVGRTEMEKVLDSLAEWIPIG